MDIQNSNNADVKLRELYPGKEIIFVHTDVSQQEAVNSAFRTVVDNFKFIDIVVANAGFINEHEYQRTINVNLVRLLSSEFQI